MGPAVRRTKSVGKWERRRPSPFAQAHTHDGNRHMCQLVHHKLHIWQRTANRSRVSPRDAVFGLDVSYSRLGFLRFADLLDVVAFLADFLLAPLLAWVFMVSEGYLCGAVLLVAYGSYELFEKSRRSFWIIEYEWCWLVGRRSQRSKRSNDTWYRTDTVLDSYVRLFQARHVRWSDE